MDEETDGNHQVSFTQIAATFLSYAAVFFFITAEMEIITPQASMNYDGWVSMETRPEPQTHLDTSTAR